MTSILARRNPVVLCQPWFQAIDVLASIWVAVTPSLVRSDGFFAGGYPISSAFLIATTRGMGATLAVAVVIEDEDAVRDDISGGGLAAPIARDVMEAVIKGKQ